MSDPSLRRSEDSEHRQYRRVFSAIPVVNADGERFDDALMLTGEEHARALRCEGHADRIACVVTPWEEWKP